MFNRAQRAAVSDADREAELADAAQRLTRTGPFKAKPFVEAPDEQEDPRPLREILATAGFDDARTTRLVVLDPRRFSFLNGGDRETRAAIEAAFGLGPDKLPVSWGSSAVFAVINTQRRRTARVKAADYLAWKRVCEIAAVRADNELLARAEADRASALQAFEKEVRRAYQHIVYLDVGDDGQGRTMRDVRLEQENQSALDGSVVWAKLQEAGKVAGVGEFDAKALLHNLADEDYGRPLDELRDLFWSTPRLPLLPNGDADLQRAIFEAIQMGQLRLVGEDGLERAVTRPSDIGVGAASLRLAKPVEETEDPAGGSQAGTGDGAGPSTGTGTGAKGETGTADGTRDAAAEVQVSVTIRGSLTDPDRRNAVWQLLDMLARYTDVEGVSHIEAVVKIVLPKRVAENLTECASQAGASSTITEL
jgi:hypothetical protein